MAERMCADCSHSEAVHDPCLACPGEGRACRAFTTTKTERHRGTGKGKGKASKRRAR